MRQGSARFTHAVLVADGRYVLQLRDDKPGIAAPGMWALFGGTVEPDEQPSDAVVREIGEELGVALSDFRELWVVERFSDFAQAVALYSFFEADITSQWDRRCLREGQAVQRFAYDELSDLTMVPIMRQALQRHHNLRMRANS